MGKEVLFVDDRRKAVIERRAAHLDQLGRERLSTLSKADLQQIALDYYADVAEALAENERLSSENAELAQRLAASTEEVDALVKRILQLRQYVQEKVK